MGSLWLPHCSKYEEYQKKKKIKKQPFCLLLKKNTE